MSAKNADNKTARFFGKLKKIAGSTGEFFTAVIDNPKPKNSDGSVNKYHKGQLIWFDSETNKMYLVKGFNLTRVPESAKAHGFTKSLMLDLENEYHVEEIKQ